MMNSKLAIALAMLAGPMVPQAQAAGSQLDGSGGPLPEAADNTQGMALMGAVVLNNGTLNESFTTGAVAATQEGTGVYTVTFDRSLVGCTPVATALTNDRTVRVAGPSGANNETWAIYTRDLTGTPADAVTSVLNFCDR